MRFRQVAFAAACSAPPSSAPAFADTTVTVLHVSENAAQKAVWDKIASDYNAAHKGVKVEFKYLENEAFKAKLPTMLQSGDSAPTCSTAGRGGVMQAQDKAGFLKDITADVAAVEADDVADRGRRLQGRRQGRRRAVRDGRGRLLLQQEAVREGRREGRRHQDLGRFSRRGEEAQGGRHHADRRRRGREVADALLLFLSRRCGSAANTRSPTPRPARTAASRTRPSSRRASACASSARSSRSSPAISRPRTRSRPACSATARRRWI